MRTFADAAGARWQVTIGKESWGTLVLVFSPMGAGGVRTSIMQAETMFNANLELDALTDDDLRARLGESRPWT
ncbi:MAG: hypothetical protein JWN79_452 [Gemmatimonadetes bacterium]|jgi:hypothetical protein|nr:hypothetical protein [Gemmatimonadota bacterium]